MTNSQIRVVQYDPAWPESFATERPALQAVFEPLSVVIEHVGSTSVPGLGAKPVIDVMVGVERLREVEPRVPALEALGYEYVPEYEAQLPERRYFRKPRIRPRTHHLHIVERGSTFWARHLLFRDYLRRHAEVADDYYQLKCQLAARLGGDGVAYTEAKSQFIEAAMARARVELDGPTAAGDETMR